MYTSSPCMQIISTHTMPNRTEILKQQWMQSLVLPWQAFFPESRLKEILKEEDVLYHNYVYTPIVTLMLMLSVGTELVGAIVCLVLLHKLGTLVELRGLQPCEFSSFKSLNSEKDRRSAHPRNHPDVQTSIDLPNW